MIKGSKRPELSKTLLPILTLFQSVFHHWHKCAWETVLSLVYAIATSGSVKETELSLHMRVGRSFWAKNKRIKRFLKTFRFNERQFWNDFSRLIYTRHWYGNKKVFVALDWTFEGDWAVLVALQCIEGRGIPIAVRAYPRGKTEELWADLETELIESVHDALPETLSIFWMMDRGYGNSRILQQVHSYPNAEYVIRIKDETHMSYGTYSNEIRFLGASLSKPTIWKDALIWKENPIKTNVVFIPKVVNGKEDWVLVTSCVDAEEAASLYSMRWSVECQFKDVKYELDFQHPRWSTVRSVERLYVLMAMVLEWSISVGLAHRDQIPLRQPREWEKQQRMVLNRKKVQLFSLVRLGLALIRREGTAIPFNQPCGKCFCLSHKFKEKVY
jgi:hypothetical protein